MMRLPNDPESMMKRKRQTMLCLGIALIIQVIVLLSYYFKEKQVVLAFPMVLGIIMTVVAIVNLKSLE